MNLVLAACCWWALTVAPPAGAAGADARSPIALSHVNPEPASCEPVVLLAAPQAAASPYARSRGVPEYDDHGASRDTGSPRSREPGA